MNGTRHSIWSAIAPLAGLAWTLLAVPPLPAQVPTPSIESVLREEASVLDALDAYVFEARKASAGLAAAEQARTAAEARIDGVRAQLAVAQQDMKAASDRLHTTLRLTAAAAPFGAGASLVLGQDGDEVVRRRVLLARLAGRQVRELAALTEASDAAVAAEFRAAIERANAWAWADWERQSRERLEAETNKRRDLLARLEKDRQLQARHATEVGNAERALLAEIRTRLSDRPGPVSFEDRKGRIRWPLALARVEIPFGDRIHPTFKTITPHPGLTLEFRGAPVRNVRSIAFGRVAWSGRMRGFGTTVVLDHASGWYSVYAGMASLEVIPGQVVREGDVLGKVERTPGDLGVRLYFELRRGDSAVDPLPYLERTQ